MIHCMGCGKLLALGVMENGSPTGHTLEGVISQPVADGAWVHCVGCYRANGVGALFPTLQSCALKVVKDFPAVAPETKAEWRARLAQRAGVAIDNPQLVAQFNRMGI